MPSLQRKRQQAEKRIIPARGSDAQGSEKQQRERTDDNRLRTETRIDTACGEATDDRHDIQDHPEKPDLGDRPVKHRRRIACAHRQKRIDAVLIDKPGGKKTHDARTPAHFAQRRSEFGKPAAHRLAQPLPRS